MKIKFGKNDPWSNGEHWEINLDLEKFCDLEGQKVEVKNDSGKLVKVVAYPMAKVRKCFKLMVETMDDEELNQVQEYLNTRSKKYADVFQQIRQKGR